MSDKQRYFGSPLFYAKLAGGLVVIALGIWQLLPSRQYCWSQDKILSNADIKTAAIPRAYQLAKACREVDCISGDPTIQYVYYSDLSDFTRQNPECCKIASEFVRGIEAYDVEMIAGKARATLDLKAMVAKRQNGDAVFLYRTMYANNCGELRF